MDVSGIVSYTNQEGKKVRIPWIVGKQTSIEGLCDMLFRGTQADNILVTFDAKVDDVCDNGPFVVEPVTLDFSKPQNWETIGIGFER